MFNWNLQSSKPRRTTTGREQTAGAGAGAVIGK